MKMEHIETLIQRYLEGKTSVAEEQKLRMFFQSADVPQELKKYALLFTWQDNGDEMGADLDDIFAQSVTGLRANGVHRLTSCGQAQSTPTPRRSITVTPPRAGLSLLQRRTSDNLKKQKIPAASSAKQRGF